MATASVQSPSVADGVAVGSAAMAAIAQDESVFGLFLDAAVG